ncbi:uncharacterized protein LOC128985973 isoform X2 [Macrosteles quadrilineatus]|uniref:uncharacterized protein LOC128985973 isoform X2 n=1 Tax=Macrosteles quadrilineatus TaxID=74068 RepID=UPI0023E24117|nr:uncharacterized protein LOC128985973 isoform X2 [Macrosteles quadrilineatus]
MSEQISKSTKTSVKDTAKTTASPNKNKPDKRPEESSPSSSLLSEDFCGFEEFTESDEQLKNKRALQRLLDSLEDVEEKEKKTEDESEEEAMTAEDADAADSDSNQMEIDEGNSLADSVEFSDKNAKKVKDSDREVMETDSVKNVEGSPEKPEGDAKPAEEPTTELAAAESGDQLKVEYCGTCNLVVDDAEEGICCDGKCERWFHLQCSGLTQAEYDELSHDENAKWACNRCSGKPPPEIKPGAKPLLTVRKDLTAVSTPSPKRKITTKEDKRPRVDISNPIFLKPFDYGWKRELVFRSTSDSATKKQGDVYYYTPKGKKLRSLREIGEHLIGTDLSIDNFTFWKDALGCDPEKEIIRDAKIKLNKDKDSNASPVPTVKKPAPPKTPKTPKTTPKLTATVTPLDSASGLPVVAKVSASVTPRVVLKAGKTGSLNTGPKFKATPNKTNTPVQPNKIVINKEKKKKPDSDDDMEMGMLPPTWDPVQKPKENKIRQMDVCSIRCLPAMGLIPTLQCIVCLCLYHPECVGLGETGQTTIHNYKCKNCQLEKPKPAAGNNQKSAQLLPPPPPLTPALSSINTSTVPMSHMMVPAKNSLQRIMDNKLNRNVEGPRNRTPVTKSTSIVGGVTTWLPPSSTIQLRSPTLATKSSPSQKALLPSTTSHDPPSGQPVQSVLTTGTHRFIVVPKHNVLSVSPATTSSTQVSDSVSTQVTTTTSDAGSGVATQAYGPGGPILPKPQVSTPAFILGSPTTTTSGFQSPPGVLLVPYIAPQTSPTQKEGQQPQYIVVNGPSGLQPGNFIIGNIPQQQQLKLASVPTSQPADLPTLTPVKRALEEAEGPPPAKQARLSSAPAPAPAPNMELLMSQACGMYDCLLQVFQYLKVQEVLRASRVCRMWRDLALHKSLWEVVRMKNSQVKDWEGFAATLRRTGTRHLDLRKMLMPDKQEALRAVWADCIKALSKVNTLVKLDMCRCTGGWLEQIIAVCPQIEYISAGAIKSSSLNLTSLKNCQNLTELRLKSLSGMEVNNIDVLENLTKLKNVSLTSVKNMTKVLEVVPKLTNLEVLELGEMTNLSNEAVTEAFSKLTKLRRLRLEKGGEGCPTDIILETISQLPSLVQLELINFDVKAGFDEALGRCTNIKVLLIIPTYVTQSATTNHLVIEGVSKLSKSLVHFVWGLTLELLRVTDLFIDQWEMNKNTGPKSPNQAPKKSAGDSIPILKPSTKDGKKVKEGAVTQVDVLQLPKLHKVLTTLLPNTRIIILKVPFSATWRQTISGSTQ